MLARFASSHDLENSFHIAIQGSSYLTHLYYLWNINIVAISLCSLKKIPPGCTVGLFDLSSCINLCCV